MNMKILGLIAGAALLVGAQSAYAVTITNGGFEDPVIADGSYSTVPPGTLTGWTVGLAGVDIVREPYWDASEGSQSIDLNALGSGSISQGLSGLTIGQEYTVSFDLAGNPTGDVKSLTVSTNGGAELFTFDTAGKNAANMGWTTFTYVFVAAASSDLLAFLSTSGGSGGPALDNITIAATPIPGAILLFGSALAGMGFLGYRRRKFEAAA